MKLSEFLIEYRKEHNLSARKFATMCGLSNAYISLIESDSTKSPTLDALKKIAKAVGLEVDELIRMLDDETVISVKAVLKDTQLYESAQIAYTMIPLYSSICCGNGGFVEENIIEMIPVPSKGLNSSLEYFAQYAQGDSMIDAGIDDGDLLVFEKTSSIDSGAIGCFCIGEDTGTCKKYRPVNGLITLQPMNSSYDPIVIDPTNTDQCFRCVGRLKKVIKDFD